jgi:hypothetical protein
MAFEDLPQGGTRVHLAFDAESLSRLIESDDNYSKNKAVSG